MFIFSLRRIVFGGVTYLYNYSHTYIYIYIYIHNIHIHNDISIISYSLNKP